MTFCSYSLLQSFYLYFNEFEIKFKLKEHHGLNPKNIRQVEKTIDSNNKLHEPQVLDLRRMNNNLKKENKTLENSLKKTKNKLEDPMYVVKKCKEQLVTAKNYLTQFETMKINDLINGTNCFSVNKWIFFLQNKCSYLDTIIHELILSSYDKNNSNKIKTFKKRNYVRQS